MANTLILIIISIVSLVWLTNSLNPIFGITYILGLSASGIICTIIFSIIDHFTRAKEIREINNVDGYNHKVFNSIAKGLYIKYTAHASVVLDMCEKNKDGSLTIPAKNAEILTSVADSDYDDLPPSLKTKLQKNAVKFVKAVKDDYENSDN